MKHKHYDCIVAWASGERDIEISATGEFWTKVENPSWAEDMMYRIVKEPVIEVKYFYLDFNDNTGWPEYKQFHPNLEMWDLKITYQDGIAIKAELPS